MAKKKRFQRLAQIRAAFSMTRQHDPKMVPILLASMLGAEVIMIVIGLALGSPVLWGLLGIPVMLSVGSIVFGRRAQTAAYSQVEGQPGAAAAVLQSIRGNWRVEPAVAFNRHQDFVHRVIGRPGVILVGEGPVQRVTPLIAQERKRVNRVAADVPVYDLVVGNEPGMVPLRKVQTHLTKLPRNLKPAAVNTLDARMRALGGANVPIPKGPLPRGGRVPRGKLR